MSAFLEWWVAFCNWPKFRRIGMGDPASPGA